MTTLEEAQEKLIALTNELEQKIQQVPNSDQAMRTKSLEFTLTLYRNADRDNGDTKADGIIAFANEVYKYIKEGVTTNGKS